MIKKPLLAAYLISVLALMVGFFLSLHWMQERQEEVLVKHTLDTVSRSVTSIWQEDAKAMESSLEVILNNRHLREDLVSQDRGRLLEETEVLFKKMREINQITHFYFSNAQRVNILRVHKPDTFGDRIDRFTTLQAQKSGQIAFGLELGLLGTFTLRVVAPWKDDSGRLVGYVELGKEINQLFDQIEKTLHVDLFLVIDKKNLDREKWESGMAMLGYVSDWDRYAHVVVPQAVQSKITPFFASMLNVYLQSGAIGSIHLWKDKKADWPGDHVHFESLPLQDVTGHAVGRLVVAIDDLAFDFITRQHLVTVLLIFIAIFTLMYFFFFMRLNQVEENIQKSNQELLLGESRNRAILDTALDAIISIDSQSRVLEFNRAAETLFGYTKESLLGHSIIDKIIPMELRERHTQGMKRFLETGIKHVLNKRIELPAVDASGNQILVEIAITTVSSELGVFFTAYLRDITERKYMFESLRNSLQLGELVNRELKESREQYKQLLETTRFIPWELTLPKSVFVYMGPQVEVLLGYPKESWKYYEDLVHRIHVEDRPKAIGFCQEMIKKGHDQDIEYRFVTADGKIVWVRNVVSVIFVNGVVQGLRGFFVDITAMKKTEEELLRSQKSQVLINGLLETAFFPISLEETLVLGLEKILASEWLPFEAHGIVYGLDAEGEELILIAEVDRSFLRHPGCVTVAKGKCVCGRAAALRQIVYVDEQELQYELGRKEIIPHGMYCVPILIGERLLGVLSLFLKPGNEVNSHDMSILLTVAGTLANIIERKRLDRDLLLAKEKAEVATQAKSAFLAHMSHEIRTPLNAIIGMGEMLGEGELTTEQRRYLEVSNRSGEVLLALINDILDISKVEAGQLELYLLPFNLREHLQGTLSILAIKAEEKGVRLELSLAETLPEVVTGDRERLRQILLNLIGNAVKFTQQGQVIVHVEPDYGDRLLFVIEDTGIGIPKDRLMDIFQPFTQADKLTAQKYGGSGLGLTICKQLIEKMGGHIWVESQVGQGSTFKFTALLPAQADAVVSRDVQQIERRAANNIKRLPSGEIRPLSILLVDDSLDNRLVIKAFLKRSPHKLDTAENGKQALEMVQTGAYDVVFMDIQMPVMDGYEATRQIRAWEVEKGVAPKMIIALSAHAMREVSEQVRDAGCNFHLTKPIQKQRLLNVIDNLCC
ncbi:MAG: PAS domain S-box protein [Magnetococcus sp. DMHC-6]